MFETPLTVVGHIVNDPQRRKVGDQEVIKFRVASNSRRRTGDGSWEPGNSLFITVNCWGKLVTGVGAALGKGAPVIVVGHVYTSEYEDREGNRRSSLEMRATSVGPDLSRVFVRIEKPGCTGPDADAGPAVAAAGGVTDDVPAADDNPVQSGDATAGPGRLPLSA
jgi:single-strand DNA-binding protein